MSIYVLEVFLRRRDAIYIYVLQVLLRRRETAHTSIEELSWPHGANLPFALLVGLSWVVVHVLLRPVGCLLVRARAPVVVLASAAIAFKNVI